MRNRSIFIFELAAYDGFAKSRKNKRKAGQKPMFSEASLREIADLLGLELLKRDVSEKDHLVHYTDRTMRPRARCRCGKN